MTSQELARRYRVTDGDRFRLKDVDPADTGGLDPDMKDEAGELLRAGTERLGELQEKLYAHDRWAVLLVFQAMDAAGKDSTIKHVMSGVNPQGCQVHPFKAPSGEELDHDYLWRVVRRLPERGQIGLFNRSHYEEVLVVRVHPELLAAEKLAPALVTKHVWEDRFRDIRAFERYLVRNGTLVRKFFLYVSKKEQKKRFLERLERPEKRWKFSFRDIMERRHWKDYMRAYEDAIRATATRHAPWYVVPADHKWFTRLVVAGAVIDALEGLDLAFPPLDAARRKELATARRLLARER